MTRGGSLQQSTAGCRDREQELPCAVWELGNRTGCSPCARPHACCIRRGHTGGHAARVGPRQ
eukprot:3849384-Prorocentrum_lima.AAC.1